MFSISTMASSTRNTRRQRDGEEGDEVQREAKNVHRPRTPENRQRQRDRGDDGGANVAQEQKHDNDGEDGTFEQRRDRGFVVALGEIHRGVDQFQIDVGVGDLERIDALLHRGGDHHVAGALGALDAERDHRLAVEAGEGAAIGDGVGDGAEIVEPDFAAREQRDHGAGEFRSASWRRPASGSPGRSCRFRRGRRRGRHWCRAGSG